MNNKWGRFTLHMNSLRPSMRLGVITIEQYNATWDAVAELLQLTENDILFEIDRHWDCLVDSIAMN